MNTGVQNPLPVGGMGVTLKLHVALGIYSGDVAVFVGAGGKSGAILVVSGRLTQEGMKVVVGSGMLSKNRVGGVDPGWVGDLARLADVVLVEADGSRQRPIKGTADHEPAFPDAATLVVAVGNVHALGTPVDEEHVHRPAIFSDLTGIAQGQSITPRAFALALAQCSLARVPQGARAFVLITGVEPGRSMSAASVITRELWRLGVRNVVLASLPTETPVRVWIP